MYENGLQYAPNSSWLFHLQRKEGTRLESDSQRGFSFYLEQSLSLSFFFFTKKKNVCIFFRYLYMQKGWEIMYLNINSN